MCDTYARFFDHLDDLIYKKKAPLGTPARLDKVFNDLPWVPVTRTANSPASTISICGAFYAPDMTMARATMWASIDLEVYGSRNT